MISLFKQVIFRFQPLIFQGVHLCWAPHLAKEANKTVTSLASQISVAVMRPTASTKAPGMQQNDHQELTQIIL